MMNRYRMMNDLPEPHGEIRTPLWLLLPMRLYIGISFIKAGFGKIAMHWFSEPEKLVDFLKSSVEAENYRYGTYRAFFQHFVVPNPGLFVYMVIFGEIFTGLAIASGTLTRWACVGGIFMMLNFFLGTNVDFSTPHNTVTFSIMMFVLLLTGAGRAYGGDHYLRSILPRWMV
jgi:thiosulfate dehydrogenase [quinone] large subunit